MFATLRPLLFRLDPERAHALTLAALRTGLTPHAPADDPILATTLAGLGLPNPIGLAAGFDKNAEVPGAMLRLGFGFVETGTVTPLPQAGNPRPRVFRLADDDAVINRLGFNNAGLAAHVARLQRRQPGGIVGVNIGANKDSADRIGDYVAGLAAVAPHASGLQTAAALTELLDRLAVVSCGKPVFVKVAPDLGGDEIAALADVALASGIAGLIVSNTTLARPLLRSSAAGEAGGLSGAPLFAPSTEVLCAFARATGGRLTLIGVGGVASGAQAYAKIRAGASAVQLYTGLVYHGAGLVTRIKAELAALLRRDGFASVGDAVGVDASAA